MAESWHQNWTDLLNSLRRDSTEKREVDGSEQPAPEQEASISSTPSGSVRASIPEAAGVADPNDGSIDTNVVSERSGIDGLPDENGYGNPRPLAFYLMIALFVVTVSMPWLITQFDFHDDPWERDPPEPDVVATFDGGRITLGEIESHLKLLVPGKRGELSSSPEAMLSMVDDIISDNLVLRWAVDRNPEGDEAFRHAVKHINEELSLDAFASQLHKETVPVTESEMRNYYDANAGQFGQRTFRQSREAIRAILVAENEPEFLENYTAKLRENASITRNFGLLEVPPPSADELRRYYEKNADSFSLPRRVVVDEIIFSKSAFGDAARMRASDLLLRIRGGSSFKEAVETVPAAQLSMNEEFAQGTRHTDWEKNVFDLGQGQLGSVFQVGGTYYIVRLRELLPARTQLLSEVQSVVEAAVTQQNEQKWIEDNGEKTLFTTKGQRFSLKQLYEEYRELSPSLQRQYAGADGLAKLADSLIDRMLLVSDTFDKLLDVKTKPLADETRLRLLKQMMEQEEVDDKIVISEAELQAYYAANVERMRYAPRVRTRYIRIGLGTGDDEKRRAVERMNEAYSKLVPGLFREGTDFAVIAKEYSEDPNSAAKGGAVDGWIGESDDLLNEVTEHTFHEVALKLKKGEISKPIQLGNSLYVVQALDRDEPEPLSFEQAKPAVEEAVRAQKHKALESDLRYRLLKEVNIVTYPKVLRQYLKELSAKSDKKINKVDGI